MELMQLLIAAEFIPRGSALRQRLRGQHRARVRIRDEKELPPIEAEHIRHPGQDLIRRMPFAGLDVPDVGRRGFYALRQFVLGEFQLTAAVANHLAKTEVVISHAIPLFGRSQDDSRPFRSPGSARSRVRFRTPPEVRHRRAFGAAVPRQFGKRLLQADFQSLTAYLPTRPQLLYRSAVAGRSRSNNKADKPARNRRSLRA